MIMCLSLQEMRKINLISSTSVHVSDSIFSNISSSLRFAKLFTSKRSESSRTSRGTSSGVPVIQTHHRVCMYFEYHVFMHLFPEIRWHLPVQGLAHTNTGTFGLTKVLEQISPHTNVMFFPLHDDDGVGNRDLIW